MREEFWRIQVYEDDELAKILKGEILSRKKLHHWPLSYVEKIVMADGRSMVYKAQHAAASVENRFYAKACAPFLLQPVFSAQEDGWAALILPYIPYKAYIPRSAAELEMSVAQWSARLQTLSDAPVYFDISTLAKLKSLLEDAVQAFPQQESWQTSLRCWVEKEAVLCYEDQPIGLLHGDLTGANVVTERELLYILDWQRPMRGPLALETALSLQNAGFSSSGGPFSKLALVFLGMWYAYAFRHLLPFPDLLDKARDYFQGVCD